MVNVYYTIVRASLLLEAPEDLRDATNARLVFFTRAKERTVDEVFAAASKRWPSRNLEFSSIARSVVGSGTKDDPFVLMVRRRPIRLGESGR